jgi:hypothetical protein
MKNKTAWLSAVLATIAVIVAATGWYQTRVQLHELRQDELASIAVLLHEDQEILPALQKDSANSGILAGYLGRIRADGVAKHADMKVTLDRIAENNSAIVALVSVYAPHAKTAAFRAEADKFKRYAIAWRDRWNSVMELFMAGGNYPVAEVPFPMEFIGAVQAEMDSGQGAF